MSLKKIVNLFETRSVSVCGEKGTGKDVLFGNVVNRINKPYASNLDYSKSDLFIPLDFKVMRLNGNNYENIVAGVVRPYVYPYPEGTDIFISDAGVYFPSQYCSELNKKYPELPLFMSLSRQIGTDAKVHFNCQVLNRVWDKIREHSCDTYIMCNWCYVLFGKITFQIITEYDKYESCLARVKPCRVRRPLTMNAQARMMADTYLDNFYNTHGKVKRHFLIYWNKSKHDTYYFKKFFENGGVK